MEMIPFKRRTQPEPEDEGWLITFADMCVLLMSFFILMFALSSSDPKELLNVAESLRAKGFFDEVIVRRDPLEEIKKEMTQGIGVGGYDMVMAVVEKPGTVEVELSASSLFERNSAKFSSKALPMLALVAKQLAPRATEDITIEVEGHTDDLPIRTEQFPSNWELSASRAANVVRYFIAQDIPAGKLRAVGLSDTQPKAANRDATGTPIPANQDLNRRIVIRIQRGADN